MSDDDRPLKPEPGESETAFAHRMCEMLDRVRARVTREYAAEITEKLIGRVYRKAKLPMPALELGGPL